MRLAAHGPPPVARLVRRMRLAAHGSPPLACLVRRKRLAAHGRPPLACLVRRKRLSAHGSPPGLSRAQVAPCRSRETPAGLPRAQEAPFRSRESSAGLPGIIIGRLLDLTLVLLLTALRKETLQSTDFVNLFRGGGFSYASRLEAIFDLFAIDLHSGRPSKAPHT